MSIFTRTLNNLVIFKNDFTGHFIYTLFIILISSIVTYFIAQSLIGQKIGSFTSDFSKNSGSTTMMLPNTKDDLYTERGSPYDNRTIGSQSANVIFHGPRTKKQIALTFDAEMTDGMKAKLLSGVVKSSYDKRITDVLIQTNTKATFFLTGMWIELYPKETEEFSNNSLFELGSHSYADTSYFGFCYGLKQLSTTVRVEEIGATEKLLRKFGHIDNKLFRFPGGCYAPDDVKLANEANDTVVHWDVSGADGFNSNTNQIIRNVVDNVQNGSIIILHMNGEPTAPKTADALPEIIKQLKAKGYEFVKVNELLDLSPEIRSN